MPVSWAPSIVFHTFRVVLYHKENVKNDFAYVLQFFSLISDSLGSVSHFTLLDTSGLCIYLIE